MGDLACMDVIVRNSGGSSIPDLAIGLPSVLETGCRPSKVLKIDENLLTWLQLQVGCRHLELEFGHSTWVHSGQHRITDGEALGEGSLIIRDNRCLGLIDVVVKVSSL